MQSSEQGRSARGHEASVVRCGRTGEGGAAAHLDTTRGEVVADVEEVSRHLRHNSVRSRAYALLRARKQVFLAHFLPFLHIGGAARWHV